MQAPRTATGPRGQPAPREAVGEALNPPASGKPACFPSGALPADSRHLEAAVAGGDPPSPVPERGWEPGSGSCLADVHSPCPPSSLGAQPLHVLFGLL